MILCHIVGETAPFSLTVPFLIGLVERTRALRICIVLIIMRILTYYMLVILKSGGIISTHLNLTLVKRSIKRNNITTDATRGVKETSTHMPHDRKPHATKDATRANIA
jgi:hypothetical protein